jgi:hypothetical protein
MTDKTQPTAHACIKPQCDPAKCLDCACAITPRDEAGHVVLGLLNAFAVNDLGHPFEDGDSAAVDRTRQWLQNRRTALQAAPPAPAAVAVPAEVDLPAREPWLLYLSDRADGVKGHYAIARWNPRGFREVWNLRRHAWSSFSDDVLTLQQAETLLQNLAIPTAPVQVTAQPTREPVTAEQIEVSQGHFAPAQEHATQLAGQGQEQWHPMETAPKDGTLLRLLVEFEDHATEDGEGPQPTIGANTWDNHHDFDEWQFAGWNWEQDCYTQGVGKPVGWLPMLAAPAQAQEDARDTERLDFVVEKDAFIVWTERDGSIRQCQLLTQDHDENYHVLSGEHRYFNTPREAIDAARAAQGGA